MMAMAVITEASKGLGYSSIGFLLGYQVCKVRRGVEEIKEVIVEDEHESAPEASSPQSDAPTSGRGLRLLGLVIVILSVLTVTQGAYFTYKGSENSKHERARTACQAQYNEDFAKVSEVRARYAAEDRVAATAKWDADLKMWQALLSPTATSKTRIAAATEYTEKVQKLITDMQKNEELRQKTPLPKLSERNC